MTHAFVWLWWTGCMLLHCCQMPSWKDIFTDLLRFKSSPLQKGKKKFQSKPLGQLLSRICKHSHQNQDYNCKVIRYAGQLCMLISMQHLQLVDLRGTRVSKPFKAKWRNQNRVHVNISNNCWYSLTYLSLWIQPETCFFFHQWGKKYKFWFL